MFFEKGYYAIKVISENDMKNIVELFLNVENK